LRLISVNQWTLGSALTAALFSLPVLIIAGFVFVPAGDIWRHMATTVLPDYIANSIALTAGVAVLSLIIGVATAWLTSMCEFSGRRVLEWALLLTSSVSPTRDCSHLRERCRNGCGCRPV
jgi:iron(III) transport system permease protein